MQVQGDLNARQKDLERIDGKVKMASSALLKFGDYIVYQLMKMKKTANLEKQWLKADLSNLNDFLKLIQEVIQ